MTLETILAIIAGVIVMVGLLFLSMIHLFMIPKDVMDRDTTRQRHLEGERDRMEKDAREMAQNERGPGHESPEIEQEPTAQPSPEIEEKPGPQPDIDREPGQVKEIDPEKEPDPLQR